MIYLDNAATTKIDDEVLDAMMPFLKEEYGNPGTIYSKGREAKRAMDMAREQVALSIGASPNQIIFTSGGSGANNLVLRGMLKELKEENRNQILYSAVEHDSVVNTVKDICSDGNFVFNEIPVNSNGNIEIQEVIDRISISTGLVNIMYVNNETGAINPVYKIAKELSDRGIYFHTDCVQAAGCSVINVRQLMCDFLSISSHKIHGPKGIGALFARDPSILSPIITGGEDQERGLWAGTENVANIVGFGKACEIASRNIIETSSYMSSLKCIFYDSLKNRLTEMGMNADMVRMNSTTGLGGKTMSINVDGVDAESLVLAMDAMGVCISAGSACRTHESRPSRVLLAMGLTSDQARNSVRISFSKMNTEEEAQEAGSIMAKAIHVINSQLRGDTN